MNQINNNYQPGDILVACDNELNIPTGYLGHSAIAVNDQYLIESVITYPFIQMVPITNFTSKHPMHEVFRPKEQGLGNAAADYALWYYNQSEANRKKGIIRPPFSFSPQIPLYDPWASVYCSKLVWLSYYYGAGYPLKNDHFLFTPEDIDAELSHNAQFIRVYKHPEFKFVVDS